MKLAVKISIWPLSVLAVSLLMHYGSGRRLSNGEELLNFLWSFIGLLVVVIVAYGIYVIIKFPLFIRTIKMKRLAKKFNLNFQSEKFLFVLFQPTKFNKISGVINGHQIEIYDYIWSHDTFMSIGTIGGGSASRHCTVYVVDGMNYEVEGFIFGFPSVRGIEKWLKALSARNFYKPGNYATTNQIIFYLIIIFAVIAFVAYIIKASA